MEILQWFTRFENTKPLAMVLFFLAFVVILYYLYGNRKRGERLESYKHMPLMDDDQDKRNPS
jgi:cbb3-type cytochrome oxidase subunit 3